MIDKWSVYKLYIHREAFKYYLLNGKQVLARKGCLILMINVTFFYTSVTHLLSD